MNSPLDDLLAKLIRTSTPNVRQAANQIRVFSSYKYFIDHYGIVVPNTISEDRLQQYFEVEFEKYERQINHYMLFDELRKKDYYNSYLPAAAIPMYDSISNYILNSVDDGKVDEKIKQICAINQNYLRTRLIFTTPITMISDLANELNLLYNEVVFGENALYASHFINRYMTFNISNMESLKKARENHDELTLTDFSTLMSFVADKREIKGMEINLRDQNYINEKKAFYSNSGNYNRSSLTNRFKQLCNLFCYIYNIIFGGTLYRDALHLPLDILNSYILILIGGYIDPNLYETYINVTSDIRLQSLIGLGNYKFVDKKFKQYCIQQTIKENKIKMFIGRDKVGKIILSKSKFLCDVYFYGCSNTYNSGINETTLKDFLNRFPKLVGQVMGYVDTSLFHIDIRIRDENTDLFISSAKKYVSWSFIRILLEPQWDKDDRLKIGNYEYLKRTVSKLDKNIISVSPIVLSKNLKEICTDIYLRKGKKLSFTERNNLDSEIKKIIISNETPVVSESQKSISKLIYLRTIKYFRPDPKITIDVLHKKFINKPSSMPKLEIPSYNNVYTYESIKQRFIEEYSGENEIVKQRIITRLLFGIQLLYEFISESIIPRLPLLLILLLIWKIWFGEWDVIIEFFKSASTIQRIINFISTILTSKLIIIPGLDKLIKYITIKPKFLNEKMLNEYKDVKIHGLSFERYFVNAYALTNMKNWMKYDYNPLFSLVKSGLTQNLSGETIACFSPIYMNELITHSGDVIGFDNTRHVISLENERNESVELTEVELVLLLNITCDNKGGASFRLKQKIETILFSCDTRDYYIKSLFSRFISMNVVVDNNVTYQDIIMSMLEKLMENSSELLKISLTKQSLENINVPFGDKSPKTVDFNGVLTGSNISIQPSILYSDEVQQTIKGFFDMMFLMTSIESAAQLKNQMIFRHLSSGIISIDYRRIYDTAYFYKSMLSVVYEKSRKEIKTEIQGQQKEIALLNVGDIKDYMSDRIVKLSQGMIGLKDKNDIHLISTAINGLYQSINNIDEIRKKIQDEKLPASDIIKISKFTPEELGEMRKKIDNDDFASVVNLFRGSGKGQGQQGQQGQKGGQGQQGQKGGQGQQGQRREEKKYDGDRKSGPKIVIK